MNASTAAGLGLIGFAAFHLLKNKPELLPGISDASRGTALPYYPRKINDLATAIARAEGFYVPGSIPQVAKNPGNLKSPGWTYAGEREGQTLGTGIVVFQTADAGWAALKRQLMLIVSGESNVYSLAMTFQQMGTAWTGNAVEGNVWSSNVALAFGVNPNTTLAQALA